MKYISILLMAYLMTLPESQRRLMEHRVLERDGEFEFYGCGRKQLSPNF
jgi:hypothetical protein